MTEVKVYARMPAMLLRLRRYFLIATALGYGLLGGGPSLWALGLSPSPAATLRCSMNGCTCKAEGHRKGKACCCKATRDLMKKFPELAADPFYAKLDRGPQVATATVAGGAPAMSAAACGEGSFAGTALPPLQPHTLAQAGLRFDLAARCAQALPAPRGLSYVPEPPSPIPD